MSTIPLTIKWTKSRARDTYGYNICSLYIGGSGKKVAACNGGGYDMVGTVIGDYIANRFRAELLKLDQEYYGLTYHNPNWKVDEKIIKREKEGKSLVLERYQAFYSASSKIPTEKHTVPLIDGACGLGSVERILSAIGYKLLGCKDGYVITND